jgi:hypothetical protein
MIVASTIEPSTLIGTLRAGFLASPAILMGLWKPLKLNTMPLVATAVSTEARLKTLPAVWAPTWKLAG